MNYPETLDYLFGQLPMYQRIGNAAYKANLDNTYRLSEILNHPEKQFKSVHIAGTNGKGSTSHMLVSILQEAGYKVGLYTSPHLKDFRERIKINGEMISENEVIDFVKEYKNEFEKIQLSFFEWTVGLAFHYFANQKVDIAIVETGLGGRLDSTNIVTPEVAVITNISMDHTQFLGDTLAKIAAEKAGIIKSTIPVVIGETQPEIKHVFIEKAKQLNAPIQFADEYPTQEYESDLKGAYQQKNKKTVVATIQILQQLGWKIAVNHIKKGLLNVVNNTGLMGRWQILNKQPLTVCDTGHNEAGIKLILAQLAEQTYKKLHFVLGVVNDKDISNILQLLPKHATYYFCQAKIPRALDVHILAEKATAVGLSGTAFPAVEAAYQAAQKNATTDDIIFIGGSTFVVAEVV
ncbi:MAG: bifunctional folylpolyglutamate synthase/dihydrofolate synthase [Flavobacteriales bacterium]|nr:bifunctional folylpolyglutamate synthase/dihydrofolate synthase [Flavobacteriales bacterium]MCW8913767.1 bifunctional folylpolyglutamate synthase/dihydrofolate synthase [Flavobacteriales bacterium]MCW8938451.1 bifunctional folylpolyglutamate synthase/dihydrofolate synthase [Flavobacteriales bacterium]MCW8969234.1 bifunctional folylpolyglutamate synthase/dihydrofolate synthase [Flavobacteriales bacterium]MCW8989973.1 bifunctional folylpolyglutamate synthase/dihydrofolate synthase [Flavobacter